MPLPEIGDLPALPADDHGDGAAPRPGAPLRAWIGAALAAVLLLPAAGVLALRWAPPPTTAFMLQSPVRPVHYQWAPRERIAAVMGKAVIAAEDQKFHAHHGFDFESIADALAENRKRRRARGASTLTQQTAKNLFLWQGGGYFRKALEAYLTVWIELLWPKERVLEVYLNIAEFGRGVYGVEAAARHYFGKPASALTPSDAARLAAILPSPRRWSVNDPGPYVQQRTAWILAQLGYGPPGAPAVAEPPIPPGETQEETGAAPGAEYAPAQSPDIGEEPAPGESGPESHEPDPVLDEQSSNPYVAPSENPEDRHPEPRTGEAGEDGTIETQPLPESGP